MKKEILKSSFMMIFLMSYYLVIGQCADTTNIYSFVYEGKNYEVIRENRTWVEAASCAVERGGILAEINDEAEQDAIFEELNTNANITVSSTVAPDGGGGSYVWIGGNDIAVEGNWVWDGNNDNNSTQFWMGTSTGSPVGDLYSNWGMEPDDFNGQDALGLSLNGWPLGVASQWNDVDQTNTLFYVVERSSTVLSTDQFELNSKVKLSPNPVVDFVTIETIGIDVSEIVILNSLGQTLRTINREGILTSEKIDMSFLNSGIFYIKISSKSGKLALKKIIK